MLCRHWMLCARMVPVVFAALAASAQSAFVRVNQLGYVSGGTKRAYLMASAAETGATFVIKNSGGSTVFGPAAIGANLGSWSGSYHNVYALDFDSLVAAGTYTITVSGPIAATSPSFKIDSPANVYAGALSNALFFYQNERDGPNFIATPLDARCELRQRTSMIRAQRFTSRQLQTTTAAFQGIWFRPLSMDLR